MNELIDLCGRSAIMFPTERQWTRALDGPWFEELNKGATGEAYDRLKIARVIRDLYLTDWAAGCSCSKTSTERRCKRC